MSAVTFVMYAIIVIGALITVVLDVPIVVGGAVSVLAALLAYKALNG